MIPAISFDSAEREKTAPMLGWFQYRTKHRWCRRICQSF